MLHISNDWSATKCCLPALTSNEGEGKMFSEILQHDENQGTLSFEEISVNIFPNLIGKICVVHRT